ncbi:hypothetical protein BDP27DRAFT_1376339 [Rhodocollybia butyracea]|uniref:Uncharacterized protein n=1 Tax=Rhodocollybia butyracea TaxID=206335 RepID=A0A9P5P654_9AGAR|nr:hypothetical protein BDP27DRAFT_1376339 [Rhodocollybia butyracea]
MVTLRAISTPPAHRQRNSLCADTGHAQLAWIVAVLGSSHCNRKAQVERNWINEPESKSISTPSIPDFSAGLDDEHNVSNNEHRCTSKRTSGSSRSSYSLWKRNSLTTTCDTFMCSTVFSNIPTTSITLNTFGFLDFAVRFRRCTNPRIDVQYTEYTVARQQILRIEYISSNNARYNRATSSTSSTSTPASPAPAAPSNTPATSYTYYLKPSSCHLPLRHIMGLLYTFFITFPCHTWKNSRGITYPSTSLRSIMDARSPFFINLANRIPALFQIARTFAAMNLSYASVFGTKDSRAGAFSNFQILDRVQTPTLIIFHIHDKVEGAPIRVITHQIPPSDNPGQIHVNTAIINDLHVGVAASDQVLLIGIKETIVTEVPVKIACLLTAGTLVETLIIDNTHGHAFLIVVYNDNVHQTLLLLERNGLCKVLTKNDKLSRYKTATSFLVRGVHLLVNPKLMFRYGLLAKGFNVTIVEDDESSDKENGSGTGGNPGHDEDEEDHETACTTRGSMVAEAITKAPSPTSGSMSLKTLIHMFSILLSLMTAPTLTGFAPSQFNPLLVKDLAGFSTLVLNKDSGPDINIDNSSSVLMLFHDTKLYDPEDCEADGEGASSSFACMIRFALCSASCLCNMDRRFSLRKFCDKIIFFLEDPDNWSKDIFNFLNDQVFVINDDDGRERTEDGSITEPEVRIIRAEKEAEEKGMAESAAAKKAVSEPAAAEKAVAELAAAEKAASELAATGPIEN